LLKKATVYCVVFITMNLVTMTLSVQLDTKCLFTKCLFVLKNTLTGEEITMRSEITTDIKQILSKLGLPY